MFLRISVANDFMTGNKIKGVIL